ncbi:MAG: DUF262 and DUF1524 domain-containing protein [Chitinophagaceae bacterium]|nr:DUF262 and DUF1524 domain-containing protein [Chitinophagaceae bacterium]
MKASSANFLTVIKGPKQFIIPIYQRTYSWQIAQCNKLFNDILRISKDGTSPGHFIGSVVYFQESIHTVSDVPKLLVIDGQQRLTSISIMIAALAEFIRDNQVDIDTNFTKLQNYYLLNAEEKGDLRYKLLLTRRDKETLINIIKGVPLSSDSSLRVADNFMFFKEKINAENAVDVYNGIMRLFIVDVALEKEKDNPQLIFESLNSTGLDLSQADLIRNYILMGQEIKLQTELYEKYWFPMEQSYGNEYSASFDWFMRDYLSVKTGTIPRIDRVYDNFKSYASSSKAPDTITEVVQDIYKHSSFYVNMVLHKEPVDGLLKGFKNISKLKVDVSYPFLLPVYNDYHTGIITMDEFKQIIDLVENYVFRRAICGIPTNSMNKTFATLYKSIQKSSYLEGVKAAFHLMDSYKRFPTDAEFEKEIVVKEVYNFRNRNYLLSKLENYKRKEFVNVDDYTIEHIMPQNPELSKEWQSMLGEDWKEIQSKYLHSLGNLTLTGYNSELSDKPYSQKKTMDGGFNDSPIRLNDFLKKVDVWNANNIELRAKELAEKALQIWGAPKLAQEVLNKYSTEEKTTTVYTIEQYEHLKGDMLDLYQALKKRILNIDSSVKEEYKKFYIAFKSATNFVDIVPQKVRIRLSLNIDYPDIIDPKGLCKDVSGLGRWGNGDVEVGISNLNELDDVMELIQQAFDKQFEYL